MKGCYRASKLLQTIPRERIWRKGICLSSLSSLSPLTGWDLLVQPLDTSSEQDWTHAEGVSDSASALPTLLPTSCERKNNQCLQNGKGHSTYFELPK